MSKKKEFAHRHPQYKNEPPLGRVFLNRLHDIELEMDQRFGGNHTMSDCAKSPSLMTQAAIWFGAYLVIGTPERGVYSFIELYRKLNSPKTQKDS